VAAGSEGRSPVSYTRFRWFNSSLCRRERSQVHLDVRVSSLSALALRAIDFTSAFMHLLKALILHARGVTRGRHDPLLPKRKAPAGYYHEAGAALFPPRRRSPCLAA